MWRGRLIVASVWQVARGVDTSCRSACRRRLYGVVARGLATSKAPPDDRTNERVVPSTWRVRTIAALAFTLVALVATARAGDRDPEVPRDPKTLLAQQLAEEAGSIDRALATVNDKVAEVDRARGRRIAAAYRLLAASSRDGAMATARRRAAARLVIERDAAERQILLEEVAKLRAAKTVATGDAARIAELELPPPIDRPVRGAIVRRFGTFQHDRSNAVLSRRGVDFEVEMRAQVVAPADGIVRYAGPIRGLETGIVLDHGSYVTVIAKLGELAVPVGAPVSRGDRLGRALRRRVYLELRVKLGPGGHPIDPEALLVSERARSGPRRHASDARIKPPKRSTSR